MIILAQVNLFREGLTVEKLTSAPLRHKKINDVFDRTTLIRGCIGVRVCVLSSLVRDDMALTRALSAGHKGLCTTAVLS